VAHFESMTFCFPMYNEQEYIMTAVSAAREAGDALVDQGHIGRYEILIVNDASTDLTPKIADHLAATDPRIHVVHHPKNRRLGGSIKSLLANARGELLLYTDTDLPFDMMDVIKATRLARLYQADVVSAYRHDRTSEGPKRFVYSFIYNWLIRLVFRIHVRDVNFSFKLMRRRILEHVTPVSEGSFIDAEMLVRTHRLGYKIIQFGVDYFPRTRGASTLSSPSVIVKIVRELAWLWWRLRKIRPLAPEILHIPGPAVPSIDGVTPGLPAPAPASAPSDAGHRDGRATPGIALVAIALVAIAVLVVVVLAVAPELVGYARHGAG